MPRLPLRTKITHDIHANHVICSWFYSKLCTPGPPGKTGFSSNVNLNKAIGIPKHYLVESAQNKYVQSLFHSSPAVFQSLNLVVGNPGCAHIWEGQSMSLAKAAPKCPGKAGHWRSVCRNLSWTCYNFVCFRWCNCPSWWFHIERTHLSDSY